MAIPKKQRKVFTAGDAARLKNAINYLSSLLVRNETTTAKGVPIFTYAEVLTVTSVRDVLTQKLELTQPLHP